MRLILVLFDALNGRALERYGGTQGQDAEAPRGSPSGR